MVWMTVFQIPAGALWDSVSPSLHLDQFWGPQSPLYNGYQWQNS